MFLTVLQGNQKPDSSFVMLTSNAFLKFPKLDKHLQKMFVTTNQLDFLPYILDATHHILNIPE